VTLCLVTDRRRLAAAVGAPVDEGLTLLTAQVTGAMAGGADLVQVREPDLGAAALVAWVRQLLLAVPQAGGRLVVNDRLDVALAGAAGGVHLRERSFGAAAARRLSPPGFLIGCSVHGATAVGERLEADYFIAGTVLPTASKSPERHLGWAGLAAVVAAAGPRPVLGIGGLGLASVARLVATGATGLAAIGAFIPAGPTDLAAFAAERATTLRLAIDSARRRP